MSTGRTGCSMTTFRVKRKPLNKYQRRRIIAVKADQQIRRSLVCPNDGARLQRIRRPDSIEWTGVCTTHCGFEGPVPQP